MNPTVTDGLFIAGFAALIYGLAQFSGPLAWTVAGALIMILAYLVGEE